jgi:RimJ/RimL family protein N-acetyltransferase
MIDLRPLNENDLPFLLEIRNDDSTRYNLENNSKFTLKESLEWFRQNKPEWFIIEVNKIPVGYIRTNGDEVGCDIHPNFRKKGYAKMAYELYLQDKNYASLWVFEDNFAVKLYKKLGFTSTENSKMVRKRNYIKMEYYG